MSRDREDREDREVRCVFDCRSGDEVKLHGSVVAYIHVVSRRRVGIIPPPALPHSSDGGSIDNSTRPYKLQVTYVQPGKSVIDELSAWFAL